VSVLYSKPFLIVTPPGRLDHFTALAVVNGICTVVICIADKVALNASTRHIILSIPTKLSQAVGGGEKFKALDLLSLNDIAPTKTRIAVITISRFFIICNLNISSVT
jgi:hypothetical protein